MTDAKDRIFESSARTRGDLAAVLQHDGERGWFYLYAPLAPGGCKIVGALAVTSGSRALAGAAVRIRWDAEERVVGLVIDGEIWAAFDCGTGAGWAGDLATGTRPELPPRIVAALAP